MNLKKSVCVCVCVCVYLCACVSVPFCVCLLFFMDEPIDKSKFCPCIVQIVGA